MLNKKTAFSVNNSHTYYIIIAFATVPRVCVGKCNKKLILFFKKKSPYQISLKLVYLILGTRTMKAL